MSCGIYRPTDPPSPSAELPEDFVQLARGLKSEETEGVQGDGAAVGPEVGRLFKHEFCQKTRCDCGRSALFSFPVQGAARGQRAGKAGGAMADYERLREAVRGMTVEDIMRNMGLRLRQRISAQVIWKV